MNAQLQTDEVDALQAIYDTSFSTLSEEQHTYMVGVKREDGVPGVELILTFPVDYPSSSPPVYEIRSAPWLDSTDLANIDNHFQQLFKEAGGEVVVYQWVEWLRDWLLERAPRSQDPVKLSDTIEYSASEEVVSETSTRPPVPDTVHGEPLTDRKSTFQAHLARVVSTEQVTAVLAELKLNKKIATATHNIMAYRIYHQERDVYQQDCDDDGEAAAGGRLLHLLQIMDARDIVVIVTRWYGGILLHADRFKHINNVARTLIQSTGMGLEHKTPAKDSKQSKTKSKGGKHNSRTH